MMGYALYIVSDNQTVRFDDFHPTASRQVDTGASEATRLAGILESLRGRPVLTIAETPGFARSGGIINLTTNPDDRIRFEINAGIAKRVGLRLSSKRLDLAEIIPNQDANDENARIQ